MNVIHHVNELKDRNHIIISTDAKGVWGGGVQHNLISFHDKSLSEIVIDGTCVNTMKTVYNKAVGNTMINGEKSPLKSKTGQGSPLFHSYSIYCLTF